MPPLVCKVPDFTLPKFLNSLGWRVNMEDAHVAKFNVAPDTHIFGVFDGHGGKNDL